MTIQLDKYKFRRYNKNYPALFNKEKQKLKKILPKGTPIEHVGSSAVPRLGGKGIIDIAIKTPKNKINTFVKKLKNLGYNKAHQRDNRRVFLQKIIKREGKERRIHIHLTLNNKFWNSFIVVRDYLVGHDKERKEYAKIKKEAVKYANGEGKKYREYKHLFLERLQKRALKEYKKYAMAKTREVEHGRTKVLQSQRTNRLLCVQETAGVLR